MPELHTAPALSRFAAFFDQSIPSMRNVDDGEKNKKRKEW